MNLMETLGVKVSCLLSDEGLEHEFSEQMNLMDTGHRGHYSLITLKAHLFHLALFNSANLSPHYSNVHGRFTGCDNSLNFGDIL